MLDLCLRLLMNSQSKSDTVYLLNRGYFVIKIFGFTNLSIQIIALMWFFQSYEILLFIISW